MTLYKYTKTPKSKIKSVISIISLLMIVSGILICFWVLYPIITFELYYAPKFGTILTPLPNESLGKSLSTELTHILGTSIVDYTKASLWFPKSSNLTRSQGNIYSLSIPKLSIENAQVEVGGDDLSKSLVHYTGPLPGNIGNPVIFGHSTLLWLYNSKDYKSIFSKLPDLSLDDRILLNYDNITYIYKIYNMYITNPYDLSVLSQNTPDSDLTLVTCVPPGTYFKRFIIKAKLDKI